MSESLRISIADDEADMRDWFERMLPTLGHQVISVAENGRQLVEHCRTLKPDLVITDIKMPEMDGIEAAVAICKERVMPVILVSAYYDAELIQRAECDHVLAYLVKPIGTAALEPAIGVAMHRFAELQDLRTEAADLRQRLADRKIIEQAKGVLMKVTGIDERSAYRRLQELAAGQSQTLIAAAQAVLGMERVLRPAGEK